MSQYRIIALLITTTFCDSGPSRFGERPAAHQRDAERLEEARADDPGVGSRPAVLIVGGPALDLERRRARLRGAQRHGVGHRDRDDAGLRLEPFDERQVEPQLRVGSWDTSRSS